VKQVLIRRGAVVVEDVPAPLTEPGTVLVRVVASCISVGTELSGIRSSETPLWKRALREPAKARRVVDTATSQGLGAARDLVQGRLAAGEPTGYSAAGVVLEVGSGIDDIRPGDRVACAGAGLANHAEVIRVPRNLVAAVPDGVELAAASTVTLGAIALQGVRRAQPTLGETFVVIGLGILGQLTVQLLRANGCRVIGSDLDPRRIAVARSLGMELGLEPDEHDPDRVARLTDGVGADGVIVTAATPSDAVISTAFRMCRRKGRVVLVGDVGLHLDRADIYAKELDFLVSTSYGPGRYDRRYEEEGLDYPIGYVRWTENRNLAEYLRLFADGRVDLGPLLAARWPLDEAAAAYAALRAGDERPIAAILDYPAGQDAGIPSRIVQNPASRPAVEGAIGIALVGAGSFAKGMHLPNLRGLGDAVRLQAVASRTGSNAAAVAAQYGAAYATTEVDRVLEDPAVDVVIIATRHNLHAELTLAALRAGKHVLVEKPLALTSDELARIEAFFRDAGDAPPILLTGFNRRFSPAARRLRELTRDRANPLMLDYRMNAGRVPPDSWVHGPEGGGRNRGEACHVYDLFTFLTDSPVVDVHALAIRPATAYYSPSDNFAATVAFADGSVATLTYTALGAPDHPKERLEAFADGTVLALDDYRSLTVAGRDAPGVSSRGPEKGQREELAAFVAAVRDGGPWPIPLWQQVQATEIALRVEPFLGGTT
jgi:predicted dehydrogenase/threonine dehydrogenase-like Zn-dependent dehydrogenase